MVEQRVVWVTGGSTGIGRATCAEFAGAGYDVAVHYNSNQEEAEKTAQLVREAGQEALLVQGDVADAPTVRRITGEIEEHFDRIDVLVNNAGSLVARASLEEMKEELWDQVMDINLKSVYLCSQAVLGPMKRQGGGRIINVSSIAARNGGGAGASAYATAKAGVSTLTRALAKEIVSENILVNAVEPGVISTPFHDRFSTPEMRQRLTERIPIGREGYPEETASVILFLASPASNYMLGQILEVNGGQLLS